MKGLSTGPKPENGSATTNRWPRCQGTTVALNPQESSSHNSCLGCLHSYTEHSALSAGLGTSFCQRGKHSVGHLKTVYSPKIKTLHVLMQSPTFITLILCLCIVFLFGGQWPPAPAPPNTGFNKPPADLVPPGNLQSRAAPRATGGGVGWERSLARKTKTVHRNRKH